MKLPFGKAAAGDERLVQLSPAECRGDLEASENVSLQEQGKRDTRDNRDRGAGHEIVPLRSLVGLELGEPERKRRMGRSIDPHERPKKRIPLRREGEQRKQRKRRA